jgi:hypothetical protein
MPLFKNPSGICIVSPFRPVAEFFRDKKATKTFLLLRKRKTFVAELKKISEHEIRKSRQFQMTEAQNLKVNPSTPRSKGRRFAFDPSSGRGAQGEP